MRTRVRLLLAGTRVVLTVVVLVLAYFFAPLTASGTRAVIALVAGLIVVVALVVWQVRLILRAPHPVLRGVQTLAVVISLFLLLFAAGYYLLSQSTPDSFNEPLDRVGALYFAITVFTTVGFGDIVADSTVARVLVIIQMIGDLLVIGVLLRVVVEAVRTSKARLDQGKDRVRGPD
jgi:voltage-gated potassium channel